jgi:hypothetical protein
MLDCEIKTREITMRMKCKDVKYKMISTSYGRWMVFVITEVLPF